MDPSSKESTFTSRKSTIRRHSNKKRTLSRASSASGTFDTTAIKPQNRKSETYIISAENATDKTLASGLQPIDEDSATRNFVHARLSPVEAQRIRKKKATKYRYEARRRER
jgi:hypothetical protein